MELHGNWHCTSPLGPPKYAMDNQTMSKASQSGAEHQLDARLLECQASERRLHNEPVEKPGVAIAAPPRSTSGDYFRLNGARWPLRRPVGGLAPLSCASLIPPASAQ